MALSIVDKQTLISNSSLTKITRSPQVIAQFSSSFSFISSIISGVNLKNKNTAIKKRLMMSYIN